MLCSLGSREFTGNYDRLTPPVFCLTIVTKQHTLSCISFNKSNLPGNGYARGHYIAWNPKRARSPITLIGGSGGICALLGAPYDALYKVLHLLDFLFV
jgi:hypothetical protein